MKTILVIVAVLLTGIPVPSFSLDGGTLPADTGQVFDKAPVPLETVKPKYPESMLVGGW
jgi:hypothetical protein